MLDLLIVGAILSDWQARISDINDLEIMASNDRGAIKWAYRAVGYDSLCMPSARASGARRSIEDSGCIASQTLR
jgi:hypothetical protein